MKKLLIAAFASLSATICLSQTFPFDGSLYYVNGTTFQNQKLIKLSSYPGTFSTTVVCNISGNNYYNALAANPVDGYIYYRGSGTGDLYRLSSNGTTSMVAAGLMGTSVSSCFDNFGRLIFFAAGVVKYYSLTGNSIVKTFSIPLTCRDIIFNPKNCHLYCLNTTNPPQKPTLYEIDSNGVVLSTTLCSAYFPNNGLAYGNDGKLYGIDGGTDVWSLNFANANVAFLTSTLSPANVMVPYVDMCSFIRKTVAITASANVVTGCTPLNVNFSGLGVADSITGYSWDFGDGNTGAGQNPVHTYTAVGSYIATVTLNNFSHFDGNCGVPVPNTATIAITANPGSSLTITNVNHVDCFGNSNGSALAVGSGSGAPFSYTWSNGANVAQSNGMGPGIYMVTLLNSGGCITTQTVQITEPPLLQASIITPTALCLGQNSLVASNVSGGTTPYTYVWSHNGAMAASTNYSAFATGVFNDAFLISDAHNCKVSISYDVTIHSYPVMTITPQHSICEGQYTQLTAGGALNYFWSTGAISAIADVHPLASTTYTVIGSNGNCKASAITNVIVSKAPNIQITDVPSNGCAPLDISMNSSSSSTISNYNWSINEKLVNQFPDLSKQTLTTAGNYTISLLVVDNKGCTNSTWVEVKAFAKPKAEFSMGGEMSKAEYDVYEPTVSFKDESTEKINNWYWYFGDGAISLQQNPDHTYRDEVATYKAFLVVQNVNGCSDTTHKEIRITESPVLFVPNSFTPNADGLNDTFTAKGIQVSEFRMRIFDRWGEKLFETSDMANGWNGIIKGVEAKDDSYTWIIDYSTTKAMNKTITGQVTLYK